MSKDTITVNMNVNDIPIVVEALEEANEEIERLNNIINGMEKFFQYAYDNEARPLNDRKVSVWTICLDKLQELKNIGLN